MNPEQTRENLTPALSMMDLLQVLRENLHHKPPAAFYNEDDDTFELRWKLGDGVVDFEFRLVAAYRYSPDIGQMVWEVEA